MDVRTRADTLTRIRCFLVRSFFRLMRNRLALLFKFLTAGPIFFFFSCSYCFLFFS